MTPTTTPAPMTHEEALAQFDAAIDAWHSEFQTTKDPDPTARARLARDFLAAERTRADALATRYGRQAETIVALQIKCAELEADAALWCKHKDSFAVLQAMLEAASPLVLNKLKAQEAARHGQDNSTKTE